MKLIEKKCPSCGATLKFNDTDINVICEYCNKTFYLHKDEKNFSKIDDSHLGNAYKLVKGIEKPIIKGLAIIQIFSMIFSIIIFLVVILGFAFLIFNIGKEINNDRDRMEGIYESQLNDDIRYVKKLSEIDNIVLQNFYDAAKSDMNHMNNSEYTVGDWIPVGCYLLVSNDGDGNKLYAVMKHTYTQRKGSKKVTLYASYLYYDLILNDNNIVKHDYNGTVVSQNINLDGKTVNFAEGYESVEKLYNREIRSQLSEYMIESTKGMYVEK